MSAIFSSLQNWDYGRFLSHVFPGFLLYLGLLMGIDAFGSSTPVITPILIDPAGHIDAIVSLIVIGIFVGTILGVVIDGIGHLIFESFAFKYLLTRERTMEEVTFRYLMTRLGLVEGNLEGEKEARVKVDGQGDVNVNIEGQGVKVEGEKQLKIKVDGEGKVRVKIDGEGKVKVQEEFVKIEPSSYYFYPLLDNDSKSEQGGSIQDNLETDFYRFFEFYLNSAISLFLVSWVLPFYMISVLGAQKLFGFIGFAVVCAISTALIFASAHTLADYKRAKWYSIEGNLAKNFFVNCMAFKLYPMKKWHMAITITILLLMWFALPVFIIHTYAPQGEVTVDSVGLKILLGNENNWTSLSNLEIINPDTRKLEASVTGPKILNSVITENFSNDFKNLEVLVNGFILGNQSTKNYTGLLDVFLSEGKNKIAAIPVSIRILNSSLPMYKFSQE